MTAETSSSYYERRAQAERAAAADASCSEAQRAHLELAELFTQLAAGKGEPDAAEESVSSLPRLVILAGH